MGTSMPLVGAGESDGADDAHMALEALLAERCALDPTESNQCGRHIGVVQHGCTRDLVAGQRDQRDFHFPSWSRRRSASGTAGYQEIAAELVDETATLFVFPSA